jgi:hypothetical protein
MTINQDNQNNQNNNISNSSNTPKTSESVTKYQLAREKIRIAKEEAEKVMSDAFAEVFAEFFIKHPEVDSFSWRQYTPFFNDGEACEFYARIDYPSVTISGEYYSDEYDTPDQYKGIHEEVADLLRQFHSDEYFTMFGDHKAITVSRDGSTIKIDVDDYEDHD